MVSASIGNGRRTRIARGFAYQDGDTPDTLPRILNAPPRFAQTRKMSRMIPAYVRTNTVSGRPLVQQVGSLEKGRQLGLPKPLPVLRFRPGARRSHTGRGDLSWLVRGHLLSLLVCVGMLATMLGEASAQEAQRPLEFEVRPSGVIAETPAERLDRRLKEREYLFRSICTHCGPGDRFSSSAPFKPLETLALPRQRPERD